MVKTPSKVGIQGTYLHMIKAIYDQLTANIIPNGKKLKAFPLRSGIRQGYLLSPLLFDIVLEVLATIIKTRRRNKRHLNWKGRSKTVFADYAMLY